MSLDQVILIDKPFRWTSFDVVKKVKNILEKSLPQKEGKRISIKVGHAGTLDPLASGLLILCTGNLTKTISVIQNSEKEYTGSFVLGTTTSSYDLETEPSDAKGYSHVTGDMIAEAVKKFPEEKIFEPTITGHTTHYKTLHGIAEHAHYHLGQIILLKKLVKQPAEKTKTRSSL